MAGGERRHTIAWPDPAETAAAGRRMAGIDFLRAIRDEQLPQPTIQAALDYRLVEVEEGRVVFRGAPQEFLLNPLGSVHGAYYAALLDSALGCAIHSLLPAGTVYTTLEYKINMVRGMTPATGEVLAEGRVIHPGRRIATSEAEIRDTSGKLYGHGTCACMIMPLDEDGGRTGA
jgi:uncharacterized protein (TIGR00369 family)